MPQHGIVSCDFIGGNWLFQVQIEAEAGAGAGAESGFVQSLLPGAGGVQGNGRGLSFTLAHTVHSTSAFLHVFPPFYGSLRSLCPHLDSTLIVLPPGATEQHQVHVMSASQQTGNSYHWHYHSELSKYF